MRNVFFDTCVYHQPGIDLLVKVIDIDNILFGSEMLGAVRGIDPTTGPVLRRHQALHRRARISCRGRKRQIFELNVRRVYPRLDALLKARGLRMSGQSRFRGRCRLAQLPCRRRASLLSVPPPGAVDAHCHVFGPGEVFPYARERKYTPTDAPKEKLWALRDSSASNAMSSCRDLPRRRQSRAGRRVAQSQGSCARRGDREARRTEAELRALHEAGVRGVRFNFVKRLVDVTPPGGAARDRAPHRAARLARGGVLRGAGPAGPRPVSGLASDDGRRRSHGPARRAPACRAARSSQRFLRFMREQHNVWSKVSGAERLSVSGPPGYADFVPFARRVVETFPDRVLWGTDWPHPNMKSHMPDDGDLVDLSAAHRADAPTLQRRFSSTTPCASTGSDECPKTL